MDFALQTRKKIFKIIAKRCYNCQLERVFILASSEKTPTLGLNRWRGSDIPMREDFVADNNTLDAAIAALQQGLGGGAGGPLPPLEAKDPRLDAHLADKDAHLSQGDRENLGGGPVVGTFTGNGEIFQGITLGFRPRFGVVFADNRAMIETGSTGLFQISRAGFVSEFGNSRGVDTFPFGFRAHDFMTGTVTAMDYMGLNQSGVKYIYAMWK